MINLSAVIITRNQKKYQVKKMAYNKEPIVLNPTPSPIISEDESENFQFAQRSCISEGSQEEAENPSVLEQAAAIPQEKKDKKKNLKRKLSHSQVRSKILKVVVNKNFSSQVALK